jgi:hypothetical protein
MLLDQLPYRVYPVVEKFDSVGPALGCGDGVRIDGAGV